MTEAILLKNRPISGTYPEQWFDAQGQCTSILFEDDKYEKWLGIFGNSEFTQYSAVILFPVTSSVLIVAKGQGYVVDVNTKELRYKTNCDYIVNAIQVPSQDLIIACDFTDLYAFSSKKELWRSDRIASDGIELATAANRDVYGKAWNYDHWQDFTLHTDNMVVELRKVIE